MGYRTLLTGMFGGVALLGCGDGSIGGGQSMSTAGSASDGHTDFLGSVELSVQAGQGVAGLVGGDVPGSVLDGWSVSYKKVLVTLGEATYTAGGRAVPAAGSFVVDLVALTESAELVARSDVYGSPAAFGFTMPEATKEFGGFVGVADTDVEMMIASGYSIYIEGTIEKKDGQSCTPGAPTDCVAVSSVAFGWGLAAGGAYTECAAVEVVNGGSSAVTLLLPAVQWLHTDFAARGDAAPLRAQWIADADLDRNGETTLDELASIKASELLPADLYDFTGAIDTIDTALDFLVAQARVSGRDAWGECMAVTAQ